MVKKAPSGSSALRITTQVKLANLSIFVLDLGMWQFARTDMHIAKQRTVSRLDNPGSSLWIAELPTNYFFGVICGFIRREIFRPIMNTETIDEGFAECGTFEYCQ